MMNMEHDTSQYVLLLVLPFAVGILLYLLAVAISNRRYKSWPFYRTVSWIIGAICAAAAVYGPLAERSHEDFTAHMLGHLLLGMQAPLLMAIAEPMTLVLRTIHVTTARQLSRMLQSRPIRFLSNPIVASLLNIGGLWLLYTTNLYAAMHHEAVLHVLIHIHIFLAGYFFTISIIDLDPAPHRTSYVYRAIVLVFALAGHSILAKYIYAHPPTGVPMIQAEMGSILMYYGGDVIDAMLIYILCYQWYKEARPRKSLHSEGTTAIQ